LVLVTKGLVLVFQGFGAGYQKDGAGSNVFWRRCEKRVATCAAAKSEVADY